MRRWAALLMVGAVALLLLRVAADLPDLGDPHSPANSHLAPYFRESGAEDAGSDNLVTAETVNYRGFDALAKVTVIFTGLMAVVAILGRERRGEDRSLPDLSAVPVSPVVRLAVTLAVPFIITFSLYVIMHGELRPGGGFQGGAIIGASLILYTSAFGLWRATERFPHTLRYPLEGVAVLTLFLVGLAGVAGGAAFLTYLLPRLSGEAQTGARQWLINLAELGIGVGDAVVLVSLLFALSKEGDLLAGD